MERSFKIIEESNLILYLIDGKLKDEDIDFLSSLEKPSIVVLTKSDLAPPIKETYEVLKNLKITDVVSVSSKSKIGIKELIDKSYQKLVQDDTREEGIVSTAITSTRQKELLSKAFEHLVFIQEMRNFNYLDIIMQHLQEALASLGEITGEVRSDDILKTIFSSFCVGK